MKRHLLKSAVDLWDLLYPNLCVGCHGESVNTKELFCINCEQKIRVTTLHQLNHNECHRRVPSAAVVRAMAMYRFYPGGIIQGVIHQIKYGKRSEIAQRIGQRYGRMLREEKWIDEIDIIVPVPLHWRRLRKRGFNQSRHFADGLASQIIKPVVSSNLIRVKPTRTQTSKGRYERLQNMQGAFKCQDAARFANQHVLLVDDVLTTGATIEACLSTLSACGVSRLSFATIAIAE